MISPLSGTSSTKRTIKQYVTRDIEVKKNLTIIRGERVWDKGRSVFWNVPHVKNTWTQPCGMVEAREGGGFGRVGVVVGGKWRQLQLNNYKIIF